MAARKKVQPGSIEVGKVYPIATAQMLLGIGRWAWAKAVQRGLKVKVIGRRRYVTGDEVIRYLSENAPDASEPAVRCG